MDHQNHYREKHEPGNSASACHELNKGIKTHNAAYGVNPNKSNMSVYGSSNASFGVSLI